MNKKMTKMITHAARCPFTGRVVTLADSTLLSIYSAKSGASVPTATCVLPARCTLVLGGGRWRGQEAVAVAVGPDALYAVSVVDGSLLHEAAVGGVLSAAIHDGHVVCLCTGGRLALLPVDAWLDSDDPRGLVAELALGHPGAVDFCFARCPQWPLGVDGEARDWLVSVGEGPCLLATDWHLLVRRAGVVGRLFWLAGQAPVPSMQFAEAGRRFDRVQFVHGQLVAHDDQAGRLVVFSLPGLMVSDYVKGVRGGTAFARGGRLCVLHRRAGRIMSLPDRQCVDSGGVVGVSSDLRVCFTRTDYSLL